MEWAITTFLGFKDGHLFEGGRLLTFWASREVLIRGGLLFEGGWLIE